MRCIEMRVAQHRCKWLTTNISCSPQTTFSGAALRTKKFEEMRANIVKFIRLDGIRINRNLKENFASR